MYEIKTAEININFVFCQFRIKRIKCNGNNLDFRVVCEQQKDVKQREERVGVVIKQ